MKVNKMAKKQAKNEKKVYSYKYYTEFMKMINFWVIYETNFSEIMKPLFDKKPIKKGGFLKEELKVIEILKEHMNFNKEINKIILYFKTEKKNQLRKLQLRVLKSPSLYDKYTLMIYSNEIEEK